MPSTNRTTILTRATRCLTAAALMAGVAFGATGIASARPDVLDEVGYQNCIAEGNPGATYPELVAQCCHAFGGDMMNSDGTVPYCEAPTYGEEREQPPGAAKPAGAPPQVAPPAQGPGVPIGPVPVAPNTGVG
jgi:hypothetical protein